MLAKFEGRDKTCGSATVNRYWTEPADEELACGGAQAQLL
jgi:hypothetical protein